MSIKPTVNPETLTELDLTAISAFPFDCYDDEGHPLVLRGDNGDRSRFAFSQQKSYVGWISPSRLRTSPDFGATVTSFINVPEMKVYSSRSRADTYAAKSEIPRTAVISITVAVATGKIVEFDIEKVAT